MKKIAFFVEGETEYLFISELLKKMAGTRKINVIAEKLSGGGKKQPTRIAFLSLESTLQPNATYEARIYVSGTDNRVDTDIQDFHQNLQTTHSITEYAMIVGLRDLKGQKPDLSPNTLSDLPKMELLAKVAIKNCVLKDFIASNIIIAVYEIEAWFLSEYTHFDRIDTILTPSFIASNIGFNPQTEDMSLRPEPAIDLHNIYQLGVPPKFYSKKANQRERTISHLDYTFLYNTVAAKVTKLKKLMGLMDIFFA